MTYETGTVLVCVFERTDAYSTQDYVRMAAEKCRSHKRHSALFRQNSTQAFSDIAYTPKGKPYFPNCQDICFSVSHSGSYIVCALTDRAIGVDIECRRMYAKESVLQFSERLCTIADRFFHPDEAAYIRSDPPDRFFQIFTAKESYVKMTGTGFDETLGCHSVLPVGAPMPSCHTCTHAVRWQTAEAAFWQLQYQSDCTLCVCTDDPHIPYEVYVI